MLLTSLSVLLSILLIGCSPPTIAKPNAILSPKGQNLPISAQAIIPNGTKINLEVAKTPEQQMMGLMYRPTLPDNRGMLFVFPSAQLVKFWMKNVPVSLDMIFLDNGVIKYIETAAPPCKSEICPIYGPDVPIDKVIELRSKRATELGLQVGDKLKIEFFKPSD